MRPRSGSPSAPGDPSAVIARGRRRFFFMKSASWSIPTTTFSAPWPLYPAWYTPTSSSSRERHDAASTGLPEFPSDRSASITKSTWSHPCS